MIARNSDIANQSPENESVVSVQLAIPGSLKTSSIYLSLLEAQALAWRTRVMSVQGMFNYSLVFTTSLDILAIYSQPCGLM